MSHFNFLPFSTKLRPFKSDISGNTVWLKVSGFQKLVKIDHFWHFNELQSTQNANIARFALNATFSVIFKHRDVLLQSNLQYLINVDKCTFMGNVRLLGRLAQSDYLTNVRNAEKKQVRYLFQFFFRLKSSFSCQYINHHLEAPKKEKQKP